MQRKFLSLVLCLITVFTTVSVGFTNLPVSAASPDVTVMYQNEAVQSIAVPQNEKKTLSAYCEYGDDCEYQWQVLADVDSQLWVDIQGQTDKTIDASYALISGVIDNNAEAHIRACIKRDGEEYFSAPVSITAEAVVTHARGGEAKASSMKRAAAAKNMVTIEEGDEDDVFVVINYLDAKTKNPIWRPFSSQLKKDDSFVFDQTVLSPTWLGFMPYYCKGEPDTEDPTLATELATEIDVYISEVHDENVVYNVYYKAANVPYGAKFLYQNIYDDMYTENTDKYQTGKAETGTIIDDDKFREWGDMEGFSALYHYPEAVAADGSTVFECYYDRNYYLLKFDMDGGYGTEPIYAKYETPFFANDPIKAGYVFMGWDKLENGVGDGVADELPETVPAEECSYKAIWKKTQTTYTTVYWRENAADDKYSFWGYRIENAFAEDVVNVNSNPAGAEIIKDKPGEIDYFTYNAAISDKQVTVNGDGSTVANVYFTRNVYTLVFYEEKTGSNDRLCGYDSEHTHTQDCYELACDIDEHSHSAEGCKIICGLDEHKHNASCPTNNCKHIHTLACYTTQNLNRATNNNAGFTTVQSNTANPVSGNVYKIRTNNTGNNRYQNYFYFNGTWYYLGNATNYSGIQISGNLANPTNNNGINNAPASINSCTHVHTEECYSCGLEEHTHRVSCYDCGQTEHTHTLAECYALTCKQQEHTHSNDCYLNANGATVRNAHVMFVIKAKYEQDISKQWPTADKAQQFAANDQTHLMQWSIPTLPQAQASKMLNMTESLCRNAAKNNRVNTSQAVWNTTQKTWDLKYYFESFDQTTPANGTTRLQKNGKFYDIDDRYTQTLYNSASDWVAKDIQGFTPLAKSSQEVSSTTAAGTARFFYDRVSHPLSFYNYDSNVPGYPVQIQFGASLSDRYFKPDYPENLEKNAYTFGGWFTTAECVHGSEYDFENGKMPDGPLNLFAKWEPVEHIVDFFLSEDIMNAYLDGRDETNDGTPAELYAHREVPHGNNTGSVTHPDNNGNVVFKGWFYYENGEKKRYTPENHPVIRDMNVFAEWGSNVAQPYVVHYVFLDNKDKDPSTLTEQELRSLPPVADDTRGYAYQGSTKTFNAKSGEPFNQLYPQFNQGVFPTYASTSIVINEVEDKNNPIENEVWFFYVQHVPVPYIVRYLDAATGKELLDDVVYEENQYGVVTERFEPVEGYVPDAIYKRLVLQYDPDHEYKQETGFTEDKPQKNVIVFYYRRSEDQRPYVIHHMFENPGIEQGNTPDSEYYTIFDENSNLTNKNFFEYTKTDATTDQENIEIKPISVRGYTAVLDYSRLFNVINGREQEAVIKSEDGTFTIRMSDKGTGEAAEFYIYYNLEEYSYTVKYVNYNDHSEELHPTKKVEGVEYGTYVTETYENLEDKGWSLVGEPTRTKKISDNEAQNEIVFYYTRLQYSVQYFVWSEGGGKVYLEGETKSSALDDKFIGSVPTPDLGYEFAGWYLDPECTKPVDPDWIYDENRIIPDKMEIEPSPSQNNNYYAKFTPTFGSLTIDRNKAGNEGSGEQMFVYKVTNIKTGNVITVTVKGDGQTTITDLNAGDYIVEQENDWSWRFGDKQQNVTVEKGGESLVKFEDKAINDYWLNGNSEPVKNIKDKEADQ